MDECPRSSRLTRRPMPTPTRQCRPDPGPDAAIIDRAATAPAVPTIADRVPMEAYDYGLPSEAIAQQPVEPRTAARLLIGPGVDGNAAARHATVSALPSLLRPGDVLVVNRTRVLAARLELRRSTGGAAEVLLLESTQASERALDGARESRSSAAARHDAVRRARGLRDGGGGGRRIPRAGERRSPSGPLARPDG